MKRMRDRPREVVPKTRAGAQDSNALANTLVLTSGANTEIPLFDLSERDGSDAASME